MSDSPTAPPAFPAARSRPARWLRRSGLGLVGLAAAVLLAEFGGRALGIVPKPLGIYAYHPTRGWDLKPGDGEHSRLGFRSREIEVPKPAGVLRVVVLGDSYTYGLGVRKEEAFPNALDARLASARFQGRRVEVVNAGVPGYNTFQERLLLEEKGLPLSPDLVAVSFFLNDAIPWSAPGPEARGLKQWIKDRFAPDALQGPPGSV